MSKITDLLDGKVSHQAPSYVPFEEHFVRCSKCDKLIDRPTRTLLGNPDGSSQVIYFYPANVQKPNDHYLYATRSGRSVVYCSDYCRKKHNHRFTEGACDKPMVREKKSLLEYFKSFKFFLADYKARNSK